MEIVSMTFEHIVPQGTAGALALSHGVGAYPSSKSSVSVGRETTSEYDFEGGGNETSKSSKTYASSCAIEKKDEVFDLMPGHKKDATC
jgi:hypothetical protein